MLDSFGDNCDEGMEHCGHPAFAVIFWLSFTIIAGFLFMNIFIAVVLENFTIESDGF